MSSAGSASCSSEVGCWWLWPGRATLREHRNDDDDDDDRQPADADATDDRLDQVEVAAQQVAGCTDQDRPCEPADRAEDLEAPEGHVCHAREHRSPGSQPDHEASREDRLVTVPCEEQFGARDVLRPHAEQRAEPFHERPAAPITEEVADVRAGGRADETEEDDQDDAVVPRGRPGAGGKQQQLARERHACALDQDSKTRRGVAERVDDSSRVHSGSYTGVPRWASTRITNRARTRCTSCGTRPRISLRPPSRSCTPTRSTASGLPSKTVSTTTSRSRNRWRRPTSPRSSHECAATRKKDALSCRRR